MHELVAEAPAAWFKGKPQPPRLAIYAHGGLNDEAGFDPAHPHARAVLRRERHLSAVPHVEDRRHRNAERHHPGPVATHATSRRRHRRRIDRVKDAAIEAFDRTIEVIVGPAVKPIWSQMKQNAAASSQQGHGGALIAAALLDLKKRVPNVEMHLIGHSAGSILLGHLLDLLDPKKLTIASCSLYAPAAPSRSRSITTSRR